MSNIPLPPIISLNEIKEPEQKNEQRNDQKDQRNDKRIVICTSRSISDDDMKLLQSYGKVMAYDHDLHNNLDCFAFDWSYLIIDLRCSDDRYYYMKFILPKKLEQQVVTTLYHFAFEDEEELIDSDNAFTAFPKRQAVKHIFDQLMLVKRVKKPQTVLSFIKCCLNIYSKIK